MKSQTKTFTSLLKTLGVIAAIMGIVSSVLYQYHEAVVAYRPDDVSNTLGLYALVLSIILWLVFLILHFFKLHSA